ncbi:MAG: hypothetical protein SAJ37_00720 [Oscillatoria sp. PMC 1068.18]|nr:hypothetical protein [Oscillatoria sp. PMC 1076.18]MEC4987243.1 hypothetical protein [Oscillatoria sp. PMC 1068.18]
MTELLQQALEKLSNLPTEKQEMIARLIVQALEQESGNVVETNVIISEAPTQDKKITETTTQQSLPSSVGMGASGRTDLSKRCQELLWQED